MCKYVTSNLCIYSVQITLDTDVIQPEPIHLFLDDHY